jgi:tetratricopeptide (TPR) repeat protein
MIRLVVVLFLLACALIAQSDYAQAESRGTALGRSGWEAIQAGKLREASGFFEEAIAANSQDATLFLGAGLAAQLQGEERRAREALQEALRIDPRLMPASLLLGEMAYRAGELDAAIRTYESALAYAPDHPQLRARLDTWRKEATLHDRFQRTLNPHFTVLFEGPAEQQMAAAALDILEAAYWRIGTTLLAYPAGVLTVVLYTDEQFRDITRSPSWAGGLFDGKIRVPMRGALGDPKQLEKVLAHEFTHALVRSVAPRGVPTWLDEGLAVTFEQGDMSWAEREVRKAPALLPLPQLHRGFLSLPPEQVPLAYAESALAVKRLLERAGMPAITALLQDLADGREFAEAFERRFFLPYADFQGAWRQPAQ